MLQQHLKIQVKETKQKKLSAFQSFCGDGFIEGKV